MDQSREQLLTFNRNAGVLEAAVAAEKREHRTNTAVAVDLQFESEMCSKIAKIRSRKKRSAYRHRCRHKCIQLDLHTYSGVSDQEEVVMPILSFVIHSLINSDIAIYSANVARDIQCM